MYLKATIIFAVFILGLMLFSCSSANNGNIPAFKKFLIGNGGGATGMMTGYLIDSTGDLYSWNGRSMEDNLRKISQFDNEKITELNDLLLNNGIYEYDYQKPYNIYHFMKITTETKENYIVWNPSFDNDSIKFNNQIFEKIMNLIENNTGE